MPSTYSAIASSGVTAPLSSADLQLELNPDTAAKQVTYDEATKTVRIPLAAVNEGQRRTKMVMFTCNKCGMWCAGSSCLLCRLCVICCGSQAVTLIPLVFGLRAASQAALAAAVQGSRVELYAHTAFGIPVVHLCALGSGSGSHGCCCCLLLLLLSRVGGRSARLVNPVAWEKGAVFAQCQHCEVWHTLAAHPSIIEEIRYNDPEWQQQQQQQVVSSTAAAGECWVSSLWRACSECVVQCDALHAAAPNSPRIAAGSTRDSSQQPRCLVLPGTGLCCAVLLHIKRFCNVLHVVSRWLSCCSGCRWQQLAGGFPALCRDCAGLGSRQ